MTYWQQACKFPFSNDFRCDAESERSFLKLLSDDLPLSTQQFHPVLLVIIQLLVGSKLFGIAFRLCSLVLLCRITICTSI